MLFVQIHILAHAAAVHIAQNSVNQLKLSCLLLLPTLQKGSEMLGQRAGTAIQLITDRQKTSGQGMIQRLLSYVLYWWPVQHWLTVLRKLNADLYRNLSLLQTRLEP